MRARSEARGAGWFFRIANPPHAGALIYPKRHETSFPNILRGPAADRWSDDHPVLGGGAGRDDRGRGGVDRADRYSRGQPRFDAGPARAVDGQVALATAESPRTHAFAAH